MYGDRRTVFSNCTCINLLPSLPHPPFLLSSLPPSLPPALPLLPTLTLSHPLFPHHTGGWATLMDLMSSMGIVCSVAIICFASEEFAAYSILYKTVIFLVAEQSLLLMKVFIQFTMPGEADWVEELAARNVHIW